MKPTVKFDRTLVTVLVDEVLHVMLELTAPPAVAIERAPIDVVVVLDRSGSMSGEPLQSVTEATAQLLRQAREDDSINAIVLRVSSPGGGHRRQPLHRRLSPPHHVPPQPTANRPPTLPRSTRPLTAPPPSRRTSPATG